MSRSSTKKLVQRMSMEERYEAGKALRKRCPRESHAAWKVPAGRRDPVQMVLAGQNERDHAALARAVKKGIVKAVFGEDR
jgi:hypothetical protein